MKSCDAILSPLIAAGDLSTARHQALAFSLRSVKSIDFSLAANGNQFQRELEKATADECSDAWRSKVDKLLGRDLFDHTHESHAEVIKLIAKAHKSAAPPASWCHTSKEPSDWEECCSKLRQPLPNGCSPGGACCAIGRGSRAALLLPLLREIKVRIRLPNGRVLAIEQDGFLRPFDVSTVVWPAGFLLSLWASDHTAHARAWPAECRRSGTFRVLELGTGTGVSALAAVAGFTNASSGNAVSVVATDHVTRSLALTTANAAINGLGGAIQTAKLDWESDEDITNVVAAYGPFDLVMGAALMSLSADAARLWAVLAAITTTNVGCGTVVALVHTTDAIGPPPADSGFEELERLSGLEYGLTTRWATDKSDFEVVVLRRRVAGVLKDEV